MMVGGIVRWFVEKRKKGDEQKSALENGVLYSSGLIAGEGLVGILLAVFAIIRLPGGMTLGEKMGGIFTSLIPALRNVNVGNAVGLIAFALLTFSLWRFCVRRSR